MQISLSLHNRPYQTMASILWSYGLLPACLPTPAYRCTSPKFLPNQSPVPVLKADPQNTDKPSLLSCRHGVQISQKNAKSVPISFSNIPVVPLSLKSLEKMRTCLPGKDTPTRMSYRSQFPFFSNSIKDKNRCISITNTCT